MCNETHALENDSKGHKEADRAPHGAEVSIAMAVFTLGEVFAGSGKGGTDSVQTVGVVDVFAGGLETMDRQRQLPSSKARGDCSKKRPEKGHTDS